ncbi:hypothetical protein X734_24615 [Mesorhizobium sp. L2C084A000]|nr:hypothetical protein X734_24615 [Mesorhizobium sp. L2C084A000]
MISHGLCEQCNLIDAKAVVHIVANSSAIG